MLEFGIIALEYQLNSHFILYIIWCLLKYKTPLNSNGAKF